MDRAFQDAAEAEAFVRETLEEQREAGPDGSGDRPTYIDEVETDISCWHQEMYEFVKGIMGGVESLTVTECSELEYMVMWRDAIWFLGASGIGEIAGSILHYSPEKELEMLIRNVGMGYHPDTPFHGYEPPIHAYTEGEWTAIHDRFYSSREPGDRDIYEFGLEVFNEMEMESRPANGAMREVNGVHMYWADSLSRWVTIPD